MEVRDVLLTHLLGPIVLILLAVRFKPISRIDAAMTALAVVWPLVFLWLAGRWHILTVWMRPVFVVAALGVVALCWRRSGSLPFYASTGVRSWILRAIKVALIVFVSLRLTDALVGRIASEEAIALESPLRDGRFHVGQGGSTPAVNYHVVNRTQRYALDVVKLTGWGNRASRLRPTDLREYSSYGVPVHAPCSGRVQHVEASLSDNTVTGDRDRVRPAGNQIVLRCDGTDVEVLLAHLQAGSVRTTKGEHIDVGQLVGAIGNSGNSTEPHLHIHAKRGGSAETGLEGAGVPMAFHGRFLVRNDSLTGKP